MILSFLLNHSFTSRICHRAAHIYSPSSRPSFTTSVKIKGRGGE